MATISNPTTLSTPNQAAISLRPDVAAAVRRAVDQAKGRSRGQRWRLYESAKGEISRVCGWNAPRGKCDIDQFNQAMREYVRGEL